MDGRIFSLKSQVEAKLNHQWTVDEMAKSLGISSAHFHKIFKASFGVTPNVWLRKFRLDRARDLIENTFEQIQQIAIEVGIHDQAGFARDFKSEFGLSPTAYRKRYWDAKQLVTPPVDDDYK